MDLKYILNSPDIERIGTALENIAENYELNGVVRYDASQTDLTDDDKTQARNNIEAASRKDITDLENTLAKITNIETIVVNKNNCTKLNAYITGNGLIGAKNNCRLIYFECQEETTYVINKIVSARFRVGNTTVVPAAQIYVNDLVENNEGTTINYTTPKNANYLVIYYYDEVNETALENTIYSSLEIAYITNRTTIDEVARNNKVNINQGIANAGKALIVDDNGEVGVGGAVYYDATQNLTDAQKAMARGNVGAVAIAQGVENYGKALIVGEDGNVTLGQAGISDDIARALLDLLAHVTYSDDQGQLLYNVLYDALGQSK